jgi:HSP20 family protein
VKTKETNNSTKEKKMTNALEKWIDKQFRPTRELSSLRESFDRFFDEVALFNRTNGFSETSFSPSCEITDEGANYMLKFDMPGISKENLKVEVVNDLLTVKAERKEERKQESKRKYLSELTYGMYERSFTLPGPVDDKKIDAKFENGVLTVTIPKANGAKVKQIAVH